MKVRRHVALSLFIASGVAVACIELPFPVPPLPINISVTDVAAAMLAGFDAAHALNGALMMKLDGYGSTAVGAEVWRENLYKGYLSYSAVGFAGIAYFEKPCDKTAEENAKDAQNSPDSSSGGGGGGGYDGGSTGGDPFGSCYTSTESVTGCTSVDGGPLQCSTDTWTQLNCP